MDFTQYPQTAPTAEPPFEEETEEEAGGLSRAAAIALAAVVGILACALGVLVGWLIGGFVTGNVAEHQADNETTNASSLHTTAASALRVAEEHVGVWESETTENGKTVHWTFIVENVRKETAIFSLFRDEEAICEGMTATLVNNIAYFDVLDPESGKTSVGLIVFDGSEIGVRIEAVGDRDVVQVTFSERVKAKPAWVLTTTTAALVQPERYDNLYWYATQYGGTELAIHKADYTSVEFSLWHDGRVMIDRGEALWVDRNTAEFLSHDGDGTIGGRLLFEDGKITLTVDVTTSRLATTDTWVFTSVRDHAIGGYPTTTTTTVTAATTRPTQVIVPNKETCLMQQGDLTIYYTAKERSENGEYTLNSVTAEREGDDLLKLSYSYCFTNGAAPIGTYIVFYDADGAKLDSVIAAAELRIGETISKTERLTLPMETTRVEISMIRI